MYGNVDVALLWLMLSGKYLIKQCDMTISEVDSCIFYKKDGKGKLDIVMSVHIGDVFMI